MDLLGELGSGSLVMLLLLLWLRLLFVANCELYSIRLVVLGQSWMLRLVRVLTLRMRDGTTDGLHNDTNGAHGIHEENQKEQVDSENERADHDPLPSCHIVDEKELAKEERRE